jgi:hypothetical protein
MNGMTWLEGLLVGYPELTLFLVIGIGYSIGGGTVARLGVVAFWR